MGEDPRPVNRGLLWCLPYLALLLPLLWSVVDATQRSQSGAAANASFAISQICGLIFCIRAARDKSIARRSRRPWTILSAFLGISIVDGVLFGAVVAHRQVDVQTGFQLGYRLISAPVLLLALLSFARKPMTRTQRMRLGFDAVVVAGGGFMVIWYVYISPTLAYGMQSTVIRVTNVTFPLTDLVLILGVCVVLARGVIAESRRPLSFLLLGTTAYLASDLYIVYGTSHDTNWKPVSWVSVAAATPFILIAAAAIEHRRAAGQPGAQNQMRPSRQIKWLPTPRWSVASGCSCSPRSRMHRLLSRGS